MVSSEKGFLYLEDDDALCVNCKQCIKKRPANKQNTTETFDQKVYAAWSKDKKLWKESSSGDIFSLLAEYTLQQRVVHTSRFSVDFTAVRFEICERRSELPKYQGSKYMQSTVGMIYRQVRSIHEDGRKLLFVGTGCQVAGLKSFWIETLIICGVLI